MMWLDFYGPLREAGMSKYATQEYMDSGASMIQGGMDSLNALADKSNAETRAITDTVGDTIAGIGEAVIAIAGGTVVGAVVGAVVTAVGYAVKWIARLFTTECDKYHCIEQNYSTDYGKRQLVHHRQAYVGVDFPAGDREWTVDASGACSWGSPKGKCSFVRYMHDGLVIQGLNLSEFQNAPQFLGVVRGANASTLGGNAGATEWWKNNTESQPQPLIPDGNKDKPWESDQNTYYYRAWRVRRVLQWMQDAILCRTMKCMQDVMLDTPGIPGDSEFNQKRRRGSRWYSSIYWMMKDVWEAGNLVARNNGAQKFSTIIASGSSTAAQRLNEWTSGKSYSPEQQPFPWWPVLSEMNFMALRQALIDMKPLLPAEPAIQESAPIGQTARTRGVPGKMGPVLYPSVKTWVKLDPRTMAPIPVKTGSRLPSVPVILLGGVATAVGAYAVYSLIGSPKSNPREKKPEPIKEPTYFVYIKPPFKHADLMYPVWHIFKEVNGVPYSGPEDKFGSFFPGKTGFYAFFSTQDEARRFIRENDLSSYNLVRDKENKYYIPSTVTPIQITKSISDRIVDFDLILDRYREKAGLKSVGTMIRKLESGEDVSGHIRDIEAASGTSPFSDRQLEGIFGIELEKPPTPSKRGKK